MTPPPGLKEAVGRVEALIERLDRPETQMVIYDAYGPGGRAVMQNDLRTIIAALPAPGDTAETTGFIEPVEAARPAKATGEWSDVWADADAPASGGGEDERRRAHSIEVHGLLLLRALERYGFPVSDAASTASMSIEARDLHNAARRFQRALNSTGSIAEPAVTNGQ